MKRLNRQIMLLVLTSVLAISQSMANEPGLSSSTSSSVDEFSYFTKADDSEEADNIWRRGGKQCTTPEGERGKICKNTGRCVERDERCPKKRPSSSYSQLSDKSYMFVMLGRP